MSRCFPFPPPGYEKKPVTDDPDLLKKEKRREKKHKKDKKDKEKKDGKEKREKERNEGKHKEKKDKHRDKKKDKAKSDTSTPNDPNIYGQSKGYNGEKLNQNNSAMQFPQQNGDLLRNKIKVGDTESYNVNSKPSMQFLVEGRKNNGNKFEMQKTDGRQVAMDVLPNRINGAITTPLDMRKIEKVQEKRSDDKLGDKRKTENQDKQKQGNDMGMEKEEKMEKLKGKSEQKKAQRPDNLFTHPLDNGFLGVGNEGILKKRKDMERNGVSHENELRPNKLARPVSNISPENGRKDFSQSPGPTLLHKQGASQNILKVGSNGGQRVNGMLTSQPVSVSAKKPPVPAAHNVLSKPSPIKSPPVITNHVAAQLSTPKPPPSIPNPITSLSPPTPGKQQPISRPKPPPAKVAPPPPPLPIKKPPHPDTRYLSQILSVSKTDQWCGFVDQEWLFSSKAGPVSKKPPTDDLEVQVWSEAKHIESVDVCALPYVIPY